MIKLVQRGEFTLASTVDVTLDNPVDVNKSFVTVESTGNDFVNSAYGVLIDSTTLRLVRNTGTLKGSWQVVEFY